MPWDILYNRPKLLINDSVKINEGTVLIFQLMQLVCLYSLISRRFRADYYCSQALRNIQCCHAGLDVDLRGRQCDWIWSAGD